MNLKLTIDKYYQIGLIIDIQKTEYGSGSTYIVESESGRFIAKLMNKEYEIILYDRIQNNLKHAGIKQPQVIQTVNGNLISLDGLVLFEYIDGESYRFVNDSAELKVIEAIYEYNQQLKNVSYCTSEFEIENDWDRIRSLDYICNKANERIIGLKIDQVWENILFEAIGILRGEKEYLNELDRQIIHSDLGADNFILKDNEVLAVIDFTPDINNELLALAHFVYWNYLWRTTQPQKSSIDFYLEQYYKREVKEKYHNDFYLLLLNASVYRILGPLFEISKSDKKDYSRLSKRFEIAEWIKEELL